MPHPSVGLICVYCSNCSAELETYSHSQNQTRNGKISFCSVLIVTFFPLPTHKHTQHLATSIFPNCWEHLQALTKHNINSLQTLSDSSEGLCHAATGVWEQQVIWPIRWGGDLGGQIGRVTVGCGPGLWGLPPLILKKPCHKFLNDQSEGRGRKAALRFYKILASWTQRCLKGRQVRIVFITESYVDFFFNFLF